MITIAHLPTPVYWSVFFHYRQDAAKQQTAGIKFTHRPKISIFVPRATRCTTIQVKFGRADGHVGPLLGHAKFHANRFTGWERGPKYQTFPFLVRNRLAGANPLTDDKYHTRNTHWKVETTTACEELRVLF